MKLHKQGGNMFFGAMILLIGVIWLLKGLGLIPADLDIFWPILLIALGISIMYGSYQKRRFWSSWKNCWGPREIKDEEKKK